MQLSIARDHHAVDRPPLKGYTNVVAMNFKNPMDVLPSLDEPQLLIVFAVGRGYSKSKQLAAIAGTHRSTTIKQLNELADLEVICQTVDPNTVDKRRPTNVYRLADGITLDAIKRVALLQNFDVEALFVTRSLRPGESEESKESSEKQVPRAASLLTSLASSAVDTESTSIVSEELSVNTQENQSSEKIVSVESLPGGLPPYDSAWSPEAKADWLRLYRLLKEEK
jgi:hypothetical protein